MPIDDFSLGKDVVINIALSGGAALALPVTTTSFEMKAEYNKLTSTAMDARTREASIPKNWRGTITLDRRDNTIDAFFAQLEAAFFAGQNILSSTITESISEVDGTISQYLYTGVSLSFENAGKKGGDSKIEQSIGVFASRRKQLA